MIKVIYFSFFTDRTKFYTLFLSKIFKSGSLRSDDISNLNAHDRFLR